LSCGGTGWARRAAAGRPKGVEADLDKYLTAPAKFLPGTTKTIVGISDAKERADIIAALKKGS